MNNILVSNRRLNFNALKTLQFDNQYILFNTNYGLVVGHPSEIDYDDLQLIPTTALGLG